MSSRANVLVCGATSDMIRETLRLLARSGARFFLVARNAPELEALAADLKVFGALECAIHTSDLAEEAQVALLVNEARSFLSEIDYLVLAHGILGDQKEFFGDMTATRKLWEVNFLSYVAILYRLAPVMAERGKGHITLISSVAGERGRATNYIYGASKAALTCFASGLRGDLNRRGVQVLTVIPGFVATKMTRHLRQGLLFAEPERVGNLIYQGINKGREVIYVPGFWRWIMLVIAAIPEKVFKKMRF